MRRRLLLILLSFSLPILAISQNTMDIKLANEYYQNGEHEKAGELYRKLSKDRRAIPDIHNKYFNYLLDNREFSEATTYMKRLERLFPNNYQYQVDYISLLVSMGEKDQEGKKYQELKKRVASNQYQLNFLAQTFINKELYNYAIEFLKTARVLNGKSSAYALDLAVVYRITNDKSAMVNEYLNYALSNPNNLNYIKNIFQNLFSQEEDLQFLQEALIKKIQKEPDQQVYAELLIWIELQKKNFYGAFLQARALDKRRGAAGDQSIHIGSIAMENNSWDDAIEIFEYIVNEYRDSYNYGKARRLLIQSKEGKVKSQFPIDPISIRELTIEYQKLYDELGANQITLESMRNKALLHAFHLDENEIAIKILNDIINIPRLGPTLVSKCKLDLGDIYLLQNEPWEASLLYSQVEKQFKDSPLAYEAKLRNAKMSYYTGYFSLALGHLDILKQATTREIANDAIALSLLIDNNTLLDTSDAIMKQYASIELLMFQNKDSIALTELSELIGNHPSHSIVDECLWQKANLLRKAGQFEISVTMLEAILEKFSYDILADDAAFLKAEITERDLNNVEIAKELYGNFLREHPGSMFAAEARKRYRLLRGDTVN